MQHADIIKAFIYQEKYNPKISLRRFKLILKALKPSLGYDETNLGIAISAFDASLWAETKKYLEKIKKENWDTRVIDLWKKLSLKTSKLEIPKLPEKNIPEIKWKCSECNHESVEWKISCDNCNAVATIFWPKSDLTVKRDNLFKSFF